MLPDPIETARDLQLQDVQAVYLLAFRAEEDRRPLYVESVLLVAQTSDGWLLGHGYRHRRGNWQWSAVFDADQIPRRDYPQRPSKAEVSQFLQDTWWKSKPTKGFRLLRYELPEQAWLDGLGFPPISR
ncbi:MAG: hypothetical protein J0I12_05340 [Candidatus Eremiobacteraeota bacterium]|nr:hypothetical protein [Candidatus Eremiobacteraeota bacterium]